MIRPLSLLSVLLLMSPALYAAPETYAISTDRTAIGLSWRAFGHAFSQAQLQGVTGTVTLDPAADWEDHIEVKIPVATLVASNILLTSQLKSGLFFDVAHYPWIVFTSSRVVALGQGHFRVFGLLSVKDVRRPVVMDAALDNHGVLSPGAQTLALHASTAISRSAFGVDRLVGIVDDRVAIDLKIAAQAAPPRVIP